MRNPNGYGSVHKLSGNRRKPWRVRVTKEWTEDSKQKYMNIGYYATRNEAMIVLAEYNKDPWNLEEEKLTFEEIYEAWKKSKEKVYKKENYNFYHSAFINAPNLHNLIFKDIRAGHIEEAIEKCKKGDATKRKIKIFCKQLYIYAMQNDIVSKDYSQFVKIVKNEEEKEKVPFTISEVKYVMDHLHKDYRFEVVAILLFTGMRVNELLKIKREDVNLEQGYMIGGSKTKAGKKRLIPISKHIKPIIEKLYSYENEYLVVNHIDKKLPYSNLRDWWLKQDLVVHTIHETRHTFISIANTIDINKVALQRIVGHASEGVTNKVYTHKDIVELRTEMDKFDAYFNKVLCI